MKEKKKMIQKKKDQYYRFKRRSIRKKVKETFRGVGTGMAKGKRK